jgi:hypothetical protein
VEAGIFSEGRISGGGRNGGGQHTKSEAGEADGLRRGQYELNKESWRTVVKAILVWLAGGVGVAVEYLRRQWTG